MQQVIKFKAIDGRLFNMQEDCVKHESMILAINNAMKPLHNIPKDNNCTFANGSGYVQQKLTVVNEAMRKIVDIAKVNIDNYKNSFLKNPFSYRNSIICRYLSDGDNIAAWSAWNRFMCMDSLCREWGQSYYAINPSKGEQKEV